MCSKCKGGLDTEGYPRWCKGCRAKYQKDWKQTREALTFGDGIAAMRELLANEFQNQGGGSFSGYEIRDLIMQAPGPTLD